MVKNARILCKQGFTTIELMVVIAIIAILGAFTAPNLAGWAASLRLNSSAREVASQLQLARMKAIAQNTEFRACFYTASQPDFPNAFLSTHVNSTGWCPTPPAKGTPDFDNFKKTVTVLPTGIKLVQSPRNLRFRSRGSAVGGTVTLENAINGKQTDIIVALTGRVNIIKN
jgi:prepilin-type N-terminal cleavage/methylation domain-containing protein